MDLKSYRREYMQVLCEKFDCKYNGGNYCTRDTIRLEYAKYINSGVCYNYYKKESGDKNTTKF
jgi:hypothetical protein